MPRAAVTHAIRTPIGRFLGQFQDLTAVDLGEVAVKGLLERAGVPGSDTDRVLLGCARQAGVGPNPARQVAWRSGIPATVPSVTLNMACGSGLLAVIDAARLIHVGEADLVVAGGMESMSRVPYQLPHARDGYKMGMRPLVDAMYQDGFQCPLADQIMGETAETLARQYGIPRAEQDAWAARSQNRAEAAAAAGRFAEELIPVRVRDRKTGEREIVTDEHVRSGVTAEGLSRLPAVFDRNAGTVTAGNSSGITDGAAALLIASEEAVRSRGLPVLAWVEGWELAGVDPHVMGLGPVPATRKLNARLGREVLDYDLVELNEAFAAQVLACDRELGFDPERLNVNGGAIALGHPIGCTGARIVVTLLHELARRNGQHGLATLCVSGGQGVSVAFERNG